MDRMKDTVRRRGENISTWEVERVLTDHPDVAQLAMIDRWEEPMVSVPVALRLHRFSSRDDLCFDWEKGKKSVNIQSR